QNTDGGPGPVREGAHERWRRLVIPYVFRNPGRSLTRLPHCETLAGVLRQSFLDLERCLETVAPGIDRAPLRAKNQSRFGVLARCAQFGKRVERASECPILEAQPCAARTHVELIVQRVALAQAERFLLAMKHL